MVEVTETIVEQLVEIRDSSDVYLHSRQQVATEADVRGYDELREFVESADDALFHDALVELPSE